jgi:hypothetical protein
MDAFRRRRRRTSKNVVAPPGEVVRGLPTTVVDSAVQWLRGTVSRAYGAVAA